MAFSASAHIQLPKLNCMNISNTALQVHKQTQQLCGVPQSKPPQTQVILHHGQPFNVLVITYKGTTGALNSTQQGPTKPEP